MAGEFFADSAPSTWKAMTLGEVIRRGGGQLQTGPFGSQLHASDYVPIGVPFIMPVNIGDNRIIEEGIARITEEDAQRLNRHRIKAGDIIYSRRGDVERRALVRAEQKGWICGSGCLMVRVGEGVADPVFTSYYLDHPVIREWIVRHAVGATMPNLNTSIMAALPFCLPPLPEQRAIAHILGTLDDKIELNRRMNETLQAMARALFKSWFVHFDPVRAKVEGRDTGLPREIADLFPDGFEESAVEEVPKGWKVAAIGDVVKAVGGTTPSTKEALFWDGDINFATPKDLAPLSTSILLDTERRITEAGLRQIGSGLLPKGTVLMSSRAPIGYLAITEIPVAVNQGFIAMICDGPLPNHYVLHWTRQNMETIVGNANGTTFLEISKANFRPIQVLVPPAGVLATFAVQVAPLHRRVVCNLEQSRTLAALRDTLLPKLISGEVRVGDAERFVRRTRTGTP